MEYELLQRSFEIIAVQECDGRRATICEFNSDRMTLEEKIKFAAKVCELFNAEPVEKND